jgi:hypothetical protein
MVNGFGILQNTHCGNHSLRGEGPGEDLLLSANERNSYAAGTFQARVE